jgi:ketosteroid isomerase-like protein
MSQENLEIMRRGYEAFNRGDLASAVADFAPEFEWVATGVVPGVEGVYRGPEAYRRFMELWWSEFDDPHIEVHELIEAGDQVLASLTLRGRGKQSGVETTWDIWHLWTVETDRVIGQQVFTSRDDALEAAGLS